MPAENLDARSHAKPASMLTTEPEMSMPNMEVLLVVGTPFTRTVSPTTETTSGPTCIAIPAFQLMDSTPRTDGQWNTCALTLVSSANE